MQDIWIIACVIVFFAFCFGFLFGRYLGLLSLLLPWLMSWFVVRALGNELDAVDGPSALGFAFLLAYWLLPGVAVATIGIVLGWINRRKELRHG